MKVTLRERDFDIIFFKFIPYRKHHLALWYPPPLCDVCYPKVKNEINRASQMAVGYIRAYGMDEETMVVSVRDKNELSEGMNYEVE